MSGWLKQNWHAWPCVVVSPEVPARGTTPLSTCGMRIRGSSPILDQKINLKINEGWCDLILHLDADQDAPVPDHLDEGHAIIRVLVERLVEEDDPSDAAVDALVRAEENLPELSAVLLRVLHADLGQTLGHAACDEHMLYRTLVCTLWTALLMAYMCSKVRQRESYRPTDSSAARMPFPGETMRRAVSCSSLFWASESVGTWCVILTEWLSFSPQPLVEDVTSWLYYSHINNHIKLDIIHPWSLLKQIMS